jgi:peptide/nickel transport system substrate-binding protein
MPGLSRRSFLKFGAAGLTAATFGFDLKRVARRQAGRLSVAWGGAPQALDPLNASADTEIAFLNAVYDYLIDTDSGSQLVPRLASSWEVSDDGLTYTLQIVEGVKFHDGSDLTIDDILWTFERLRGGGPTADLFANVASIEAGDGNSVVFTLNTTNPDFLYNLTDNHAVILKADAQNIGNEFNGTGPFRLEEYLPNDRAVFAPNADYWAGAPAVEGLEFVYFDSAESAVNALQSDVVNVVLRMDNATYLNLSGEGTFTAQAIPTSGHDVVRLRADREPGSSEQVRQAFRLATDRQAIFDRIQLGFGAIGRDSPISPVFQAYYTEDTPVPARDPEAAKQLLADAGYPDGLDMTLYVPDLADRVALAEALAAQWADAGIRITIERQDEATYYADDGWLEVDLGITPWGARPVPQVYLDLYLKTGAQWNESHFSDSEVDQLIETAGSSLDETERVNAYHEIQRILIERGPLIIPYFFAQFGVMSNQVGGVEVHPFAGRTNFTKATVG